MTGVYTVQVTPDLILHVSVYWAHCTHYRLKWVFFTWSQNVPKRSTTPALSLHEISQVWGSIECQQMGQNLLQDFAVCKGSVRSIRRDPKPLSQSLLHQTQQLVSRLLNTMYGVLRNVLVSSQQGPICSAGREAKACCLQNCSHNRYSWTAC